jgi:hypothetical protein
MERWRGYKRSELVAQDTQEWADGDTRQDYLNGNAYIIGDEVVRESGMVLENS